MNAIRGWYIHNQDAITWFIVGLLTGSLIEHLATQQYAYAAIDALIIWINVKLSKVRLQ